MTTAAEVFDPQLLRALRAAPWRTIERRFLLILAASIGLHLAFASYLRSQPMPVTAEGSIDSLDRFAAAPLPPLHRIPVIPNLPVAPARPVVKQPTVAAPPEISRLERAHEAISKTPMIRLLTAGPGGALGEVLGPSSSVVEISQALDGAQGVTVAGPLAPTGPRGPQTGETTTIAKLGTDGVQKVALAPRVEHAPTAIPDGPLVVETESELDPRKLQQFIVARRAAMQSCYERELVHRPTLSGKVVLRLTIGAGGRVGGLEIDEDTLGSEAVTACMSTLVKRWVFPVSPKAAVTVAVPFIFAHAN